MRSESGELAYLNALEDEVFIEFSSLFDNMKKEISGKIFNIREEIKTIHDTFGFACDPAPDSTYFQISNKPLCPQCGKKEFQSYGPTTPPEFIHLDVSNVTHALWHTLSSNEKKQILSFIFDNDNKKIIDLLNQR